MSIGIKNRASIKVFSSNIGKMARKLNKQATRELASDKVVYTFPKATAEDLKRLTSKTLEDSYKRVRWVNPNDGKVYFILENGRSKKGISVRILSSEGEFIKNAKLQPKTVVVFDQFKNLGWLRSLLKGKFEPTVSHGEVVETFLRRTNPFVTVEHIEHKQNIFELLKYRGQLPQKLMNKRFEKLNKQMGRGHNVDYISISEVNVGDIGHLSKKQGHVQKAVIQQNAFKGPLAEMKDVFSSIVKKGTRIFASASNEPVNPQQKVNVMLAIDGVEGVGAIVKNPKGVRIAPDSASRNSMFTQHYEQKNYHGRVVEENGKILGINITGQPGVDVPYNKKNQSLLRPIAGTSFATPVRVAKIALNEMMKGIL